MGLRLYSLLMIGLGFELRLFGFKVCVIKFWVIFFKKFI